ncbi:MAG: LuxR C-terminal-related transcriptional regulator [Candidatus Dormiibacterota bacterium]
MDRRLLGARIDAVEARRFQGRTRELGRLLDLMSDPSALPRIVRLHGRGGIGKTSLLRIWRMECQRRGLGRVVVLDSREFHHRLTAFTRLLEQRLDGWPDTGTQPVGIAVDTFEEMGDMDWRFREGFLRELVQPVLVVLSGRRLPPLIEESPAWREVVEDMPLDELSQEEAVAYLHAEGVGDREMSSTVVRFAGGNPLALGLSADLCVRMGVRDLSDVSSTDTMQALLQRMTSEVREDGGRSLLESASLVRSFDQELLEAMAGPVGQDAFARFTEFSIVEVAPRGYKVHDLVRRMVAPDLQRRRPRIYRQLKQKAYLHLLGIARDRRHIPYDVLEELLFLSEEAVVQSAFFDERPGARPELRPVVAEEHDLVRQMARAWAEHLPGVDLASLLDQLDLFIRLAPEWLYFAVDDTGHPVGFCNAIPLNRSTVPQVWELWETCFRSLPGDVLARFSAAGPGDASAGIVIGFVIPAHDRPEVHSALLRASILARALATRYLIAMTPHPRYKQLFGRLQFRPLGVGQRLYSSELVHETFVLDLTEGFEGWIQRLLGIESPQSSEGRLTESIAQVSGPATGRSPEGLTAREVELLVAVAAGLGNKQIGRRLGISENTVRNHLSNIYRKIQVQDRSQAVLYAVRQGLIEVG